jgi:hypothetical protein
VPVDLSKIRAATGRVQGRGHKAGYRPDDIHVEVLDRVHLRKEWKRPGTATYWVELLHHEKRNDYQVRKSWKWFKGGSEGWINGEVWFGRPRADPQDVTDAYGEALQGQFEKGYVIEEHERDPKSPIREDMPAVLQAQAPRTKAPPPATTTKADDPPPLFYEEDLEEPKKPTPMRRKGELDWW